VINCQFSRKVERMKIIKYTGRYIPYKQFGQLPGVKIREVIYLG